MRHATALRNEHRGLAAIETRVGASAPSANAARNLRVGAISLAATNHHCYHAVVLHLRAAYVSKPRFSTAAALCLQSENRSPA